MTKGKKRAPIWTTNEFDLLLQNSSLSDSDLVEIIPSRSEGALQIVRSGIHEFHKKGDSPVLSNMMKKRLKQVGSTRICPVCKEPISTPN
jgi:hypothetical protein